MKIMKLFLALTVVAAAALVLVGQVPPTQADKPLKIKKMPSARAYGCDSGTTGTIRVRVTFRDSGVVGDVVALTSSGCKYFDDSAMKAAKKIKFDPAVKNGVAATVSRLIEYNYRKG
jgi:TonB family protein